MDNKDIEIFLEIVKARNISRAADNMFLSQSVISTRLKKLEDELGYDLFSRFRGGRDIVLTRQGEEFISVAMRMKNLYEEAALLKQDTQTVLRLAAPESVYYDFVEPLIIPFMNDNPDIRLSVKINDSSEVYDLMDKGVIDFGFASYESSRSNIVYKHLYDQNFSIVSYSDFPISEVDGTLSPKELDPKKEIQLSGGNFSSVSLWREKWFEDRGGSRIEINSPHMITNLLKEDHCWSILPETVCTTMNSLYGLKIYTLSDRPGSRNIFLLSHNAALQTEASERFYKKLSSYIE